MLKINRQALNEVEQALDHYEAEVEATKLTKATKHTYLLHARNFVRWLNGDFQPGETLSN